MSKPNPADELRTINSRIFKLLGQYEDAQQSDTTGQSYGTIRGLYAAKIETLIAQSHLDWLDSVLPEKLPEDDNLPPEEQYEDEEEQFYTEGFNQAIDTIKANAIKSVGGEL